MRDDAEENEKDDAAENKMEDKEENKKDDEEEENKKDDENKSFESDQKNSAKEDAGGTDASPNTSESKNRKNDNKCEEELPKDKDGSGLQGEEDGPHLCPEQDSGQENDEGNEADQEDEGENDDERNEEGTEKHGETEKDDGKDISDSTAKKCDEDQTMKINGENEETSSNEVADKEKEINKEVDEEGSGDETAAKVSEEDILDEENEKGILEEAESKENEGEAENEGSDKKSDKDVLVAKESVTENGCEKDNSAANGEEAKSVPEPDKAQWKSQFQLFSKFGDKSSDGSTIKLSQSDKWFKQAGIIRPRGISTTDTGISFRKVSKKAPKLSFPSWCKYLDEISATKKKDVNVIKTKLVACGPPAITGGTKTVKSAALRRLTDSSAFSGTQRQRFDSPGRGKGKDSCDETKSDKGIKSKKGVLATKKE